MQTREVRPAMDQEFNMIAFGVGGPIVESRSRSVSVFPRSSGRKNTSGRLVGS